MGLNRKTLQEHIWNLEPKSKLTIEESEVLLEYIQNMEKQICAEGMRLPVTKNVIFVKTKLIAMADGNFEEEK